MNGEQRRISPWHLTIRQAKIMDTMVTTGSIAETAACLAIEVPTVRDHLKQIHIRMGSRYTTRTVVMWDRWRRGANVLP